LSATVQERGFQPTWTRNRLVKGEGLGAKLLTSPASARQNYKVISRRAWSSSCGQRARHDEIDMPNRTRYIHDTPNRALFSLTSPTTAFTNGP
jgi:hypothetical protein